MSETNGTTRRRFVQGASLLALSAGLSHRSYAAESDTIRVGLVGCGGRGTGAAVNALLADPGAKLVAMGDAFADMLASSLTSLKKNSEVSDRVEVPTERQFVGFNAYKDVIDACDVVCLATPPHFRPMHLKYAVEKGVHAFVEKPVAVDPVALRDIFETCERAKAKNLSIVSGLCWRYHPGKIETVKRIRDGMIGDIVTCETYYLAGTLWHRGRKPHWSEMEYQVRNWLYFDWLSGDHIVEQHIHSLDKIAWAMNDEPPARILSIGGRQQRTGERFGNVYDHFSTVFEYESGVRAYSYCRQMADVTTRVSDRVHGTNGTATLLGFQEPTDRIVDRKGQTLWRYRKGDSSLDENMYQNEHDLLFQSIRSGEPIHNGDYMCKSTMMAIAARMSAYRGKMLSWDECWNSALDLSPNRYEWADAPHRSVPIPGST